MRLETHSAEETRKLGRFLGERLVPGSVVALYGDLGSGKTCLAQGIARGLDVPEQVPVTSPTYTFINEYPGRIPLYHMDLYRVTGPSDLEEIGFYECLHGQGASLIEWACRLEPRDLYDHLRVDFASPAESVRSLTFSGTGLMAGEMLMVLESVYQKKDKRRL